MSAADSYRTSYRNPFYNTITPYRFVQDLDLEKRVRVNEGSTVEYNGQICKAVNLNIVLRHGSRSPFLFEIKNINKLYTKLVKDPQVAKRFPVIKTWKNPFTEDRPNTQLEEGDREQSLLGRRFGRKFKNFFQDNLDTVKYIVTHTSVAIRSYEMFSESLHSYFRSEIRPPRAEIDNRKLYFHTQCKSTPE